MNTKQQFAAVLQVVQALNEAVIAAGPQGIPAGHLYAAVMGRMSLITFEQAMGRLIKARKVTLAGNVYRVA